MNLMSMVNGLNRLDDTNPLSPTAFTLAVKLIDLFNGLRWADSVAIDLNRMSVLAKCSPGKTAIRARDELISRGILIVVRKGKKGSPAIYRMNDLEKFRGLNPVNPPLISNTTYYRQDKTKTKEEDVRATAAPWISDDEAAGLQKELDSVLDAASNAGMPASQTVMDSLTALCAEYSPAWVLEAIRQAAESDTRGKPSIRFVRAILERFHRQGGPQGSGGRIQNLPARITFDDDPPIAPGEPVEWRIVD